MNILVTGGAGYIGSHTVKALISKGHNVVVLDNLSKGHQDAVIEGDLIKGDIRDRELLSEIFNKYSIEAVVHFAADSLVGESMADPSKYYQNNIVGGLSLIDSMIQNNVSKIVFSSTAAVYGEPKNMPITEESVKEPTNNYGLSKLMFENILRTYDTAYGLKSICLRYFNAAGADPSGKIGEDHSPETHLIPIVLQVALGQREKISIFGTDYPTPDGTCIRDYIHVNDLADAHVLALEALMDGYQSDVYNLGNGQGFSVREVISTAEALTGKAIPVIEDKRRAGDPAVLVASSDKIRKALGWQPKFPSLEDIISTAWNWHKNHPKGFNKSER